MFAPPERGLPGGAGLYAWENAVIRLKDCFYASMAQRSAGDVRRQVRLVQPPGAVEGA